MPTARSRKTVVGTVSSPLVLINPVGLAHEADLSAALMESSYRGVERRKLSWVTSYASR